MEMNRERLFEALKAKEKELRSSFNDLRSSGLAQSETESTGELSAYDNHPADLGTETFEREKDLGLQGTAKDLLVKVEAALRRLDQGTYGTCVRCGRGVGEGRLEAQPWSDLCINCQRAEEIADPHPRPLEEEVLSPPFGRSFRDGDKEGTVEFDGEDAWQAVARFGTSNSPADEPGGVTYDQTYVGFDEKIGIVEDVEGVNPDETLEDPPKESQTDRWPFSQPSP